LSNTRSQPQSTACSGPRPRKKPELAVLAERRTAGTGWLPKPVRLRPEAEIVTVRLRARLGWEPGILNGGGEKPKWMRWRTFERLAAQHDQLVRRSMQAMILKLGGSRGFPE
jgi:hypothetical protein